MASRHDISLSALSCRATSWQHKWIVAAPGLRNIRGQPSQPRRRHTGPSVCPSACPGLRSDSGTSIEEAAAPAPHTCEPGPGPTGTAMNPPAGRLQSIDATACCHCPAAHSSSPIPPLRCAKAKPAANCTRACGMQHTAHLDFHAPLQPPGASVQHHGRASACCVAACISQTLNNRRLGALQQPGARMVHACKRGARAEGTTALETNHLNRQPSTLHISAARSSQPPSQQRRAAKLGPSSRVERRPAECHQAAAHPNLCQDHQPPRPSGWHHSRAAVRLPGLCHSCRAPHQSDSALGCKHVN